MDQSKPCLILTFNHGVEKQPSSTFAGGWSYTCPRCGHEFTEAHPTAQSMDRCVFEEMPISR